MATNPIAVPQAAATAAGARGAVAWTYTDAFSAAVTTQRPALAWFRHMLEEPPRPIRVALRTVWTLIGVPRGRRDEGHVLGLPVEHVDDGTAVLRATSWLGADGRLVMCADATTISMSSFVHARTRAARLLWPFVAPVHRFAVARLLARAAR